MGEKSPRAESTSPSSTRAFVLGLMLGVVLTTVVGMAVWKGGAGATQDREHASQTSRAKGVALTSVSKLSQVPKESEHPVSDFSNGGLSFAKGLASLSTMLVPSNVATAQERNDTWNHLRQFVFRADSEGMGSAVASTKANATVSNPAVASSTSSSSGSSAPASLAEKETERERCRAFYGERNYLPEELKRLPPMFYTFPGSGNTWGRLLLEYATGIYTGSVYNDASLLKALPGEFTCNWRVSVVKAHPHTHTFAELHGTKVPSDDGKCNKGNVRRFDRAILVIRDPFDSIWSEYQRRVSKSHVDGIQLREFSWKRWQANAASLAHYYYDMWHLEHAGIEREFKPEDYIYIKYEDLRDKSKRMEALKRMVDFLRYKHISASELEKRLACAFLLAESKHAHRHVDKTKVMTKDIAYVPEIACRMWALFGGYASKVGYKPWAGYNCTGYKKIPPLMVGPGGEIDRTGAITILSQERITSLMQSYLHTNSTHFEDPDMLTRRRDMLRRRGVSSVRKKVGGGGGGGGGKGLVSPEDMRPANVAGGLSGQVEGSRKRLGGGGRKPGMGGRKQMEDASAAANKLLEHTKKIMNQ